MAQTSGAIGIDLGSNNIVIAVAKKGGIEILANEGSHRETQNIVGFSQNERFIGEQAALKFKSNFKNTITNANRFLGLKANCEFIDHERRYLFSTLVPGPDNRLIFEVTYMGEKRQFFPEQIVAMVLQKVKQIIHFNGITSFDAVISVPSYYTEQERKALLDATKIAELPTMQILNEHAATAVNYGIFRKREFDENQRFVAFVDFGHTKTSAYVVSFTKDKLKVLAHVHDRNLGARDMDWILYDYYVNMFEKANGCKIRQNDKARMKILEALEKQRRVLSANAEAPMHLEYLYEDYDLNHVLPRGEFEAMVQPVIARFRALLDKILAETKEIKLHSVEIVGGATRIPLIQKAIEEAFKVESVSKTLHASECIARGCAIQAAILSPLFKVIDYGVEDINYYPIRCSWKFLDPAGGAPKMEIEDPKTTSILYDKNCQIPSTKSLNFKRSENIELVLTYDPPVPGADDLIARYVIQNKKAQEAEFGVKAKLKLNENGVVSLESTQLVEDYIEEVKEAVTPPPQPVPAPAAGGQPAAGTQAAPQGSPMNPEQPAGGEQKPAEGQPAAAANQPPAPTYEIKKKKRTRATDLKCDSPAMHQFSEKQIQTFHEEEVRMANNDRVIYETNEKKNDLEAFIYNNRNHLNGGQYAQYTVPADAQKIIDALGEAEKWLYGEGATAAKSVYVTKLDGLKQLTEAVVKRYKEHQFIPEILDDFNKVVQQYEAIITSKEDKYAHLDESDRQKVINDINVARQFIANVKGTLQTHPKHQDLPVSQGSIRGKIDEFVKNNQPIISKPKPAPPPAPPAEPKPSQDKPAEGNAGATGAGGAKMETEKDPSKMEIEK